MNTPRMPSPSSDSDMDICNTPPNSPMLSGCNMCNEEVLEEIQVTLQNPEFSFNDISSTNPGQLQELLKIHVNMSLEEKTAPKPEQYDQQLEEDKKKLEEYIKLLNEHPELNDSHEIAEFIAAKKATKRKAEPVEEHVEKKIKKEEED